MTNARSNPRGPFKAQALQQLIQRGVPVRTVLDVGVMRETPELRAAFPRLKHVMFEPVVEFNPAITQRYNNIDIEIHNVAVSNMSGEVTLEVSSIFDHLPISHARIVSETEPRRGRTRRVPMVSIDDFLRTRKYELPYLLKVDVDGVEMTVLQGARDTLPHCTVVIVEATGPSLAERLGYLQHAGFQLFDIVEPCYYDDAFWQCDLVMVRDDVWSSRLGQTGDVTDIRKYTIFR